MSDAKKIEILKLHSIFLDRNKAFVDAIRNKEPRHVVAAIYSEIKQLYSYLSKSEFNYLAW